MIGIIPGTALYVYTGTVAGAVAGAVRSGVPPRGVAYHAVLALGPAATAVVSVVITRAARRALREAEPALEGTADG